MEVFAIPTDDPLTMDFAFETGAGSKFPKEVTFSTDIEARKSGYYIAEVPLANNDVAKVTAFVFEGVDCLSVTLKQGKSWGAPAQVKASPEGPETSNKITLLDTRNKTAALSHEQKITLTLQNFLRSGQPAYENPTDAKTPSLEEVRNHWNSSKDPIKQKMTSDNGGFSINSVDTATRSFKVSFTDACRTRCVESNPTGTIQSVVSIFRRGFPGWGVKFE